VPEETERRWRFLLEKRLIAVLTPAFMFAIGVGGFDVCTRSYWWGVDFGIPKWGSPFSWRWHKKWTVRSRSYCA
jgi:hypothetical protein